MVKIKQTGCESQRIEVSGLSLGILDLENRVAFVPDSDALMETVDRLGIWKALDILDISVAYTELMETLRERGFSIKYYKPESVKETRRVYDILSKSAAEQLNITFI